jgi:hypothetical protein
VDLLTHADGRRFVFLVSQASDELTIRPAVSSGTGRLSGLTDGLITLAPYGVRVLELLDAA